MEKELQRIYDSEINVDISCFWDGGWRVRLGDRVNGYKEPKWDCCELHEIVPALRELAKKHYPRSKYAMSLRPWYQRALSPYRPLKVSLPLPDNNKEV